jgi:hypothetical protein
VSTRACPACGARNAAAAPWCTQCYTSFADTRTAPTAPAAAPAAEEPPVQGPPGQEPPLQGPPTQEPPAQQGEAPPRAGAAADVRQDEQGRIEWRCATCDGWSPLEVAACVACGSPRKGFGDDRAVEVPDEQRVVVLSGLLPGLGHLVAGRVGSGLARALFGVGWLVGGVLLLVAAVRAGSGHWAAVPLLAGAVIVWVLSVVDAQSLARGQQREYLDGRTLLWLMVGVTCLLVVALLLDAWRLTG